jgi:diguanylate cyclase (GGDEF)-like protein/PAS domain S-box-containing protein
MNSEIKRLQQRITALEDELTTVIKQGETLSKAHEDLLNLEEMPLLFLDQQYYLLDYTSAFSDLVGDIEDYLGEPISRLLKESSWEPIEQALASKQNILATEFDEKGKWEKCYQGPRKGENIGNEWFVFPGSGTWSIAPGLVRLESEYRERDSFLTLAQPVGGAGEDLRITFTITTPEKADEIKDLSVVLSGTDGADGRYPYCDGYFVGIGAASNRRLEIQKKSKAINKHFLSLEPKRDYQIKILRLGGHIKLYLDNKQMLAVTDINPLYGLGHEFFSLYSYGSEATFRDILIETRPAAYPHNYFCLAERFEVELVHMAGCYFELGLSEGLLPDSLESAVRIYFKDITSQKVLQQRLTESRERLHDLLEALPVGIFQMTEAGDLLFVNRHMVELFGYRDEKGLIGKINFEAFFLNREDKYGLMEVLLRKKIVRNFVFSGITLENRKIWLEASLRLSTEPGDDNRRIVQGILVDITRRKMLEDELIRSSERMKKMSIFDEQTQTYNSRYFRRLLDEELDRAVRYDRTLTLLMLDIDHFKKINDRLGRKGGDQVLRQLADLISRVLRNPDNLARFGGEEFTILLPETEKEEGLVVAERLLNNIAAHKFEVSGSEIQLTVSIGLGTTGEKTDAETLIKLSDDALAEAKSKGRNRVVVAGEQPENA